MIDKALKVALLIAGFLALHTQVQAQKFGYLNSALLLSEMPEVKVMRSNLEGFRTQLEKKGKQMVEDFQRKQRDAAAKEERGELSPVQRENLLKELQAKEQEILKYQSESQQKLAEKEQELLQPILDKVNKAIQEVAKEHGFQFIFDASTGILLYADESQDVSSLVKAKLGI